MSDPDPVQPPSLPPLCGIVLFDKPARRGMTSMVAVHEVHRRLVAGGVGAWKQIRIGHAGTLDPLASGLLVVLVGKATKMAEPLMAREKWYRTTIDLSRRSPSDDLERPTEVNPIDAPPSRQAVEAALARWVGEVEQRPPDHSAIWVDGHRAYHLARRGREVNFKPRTVRIDAMTLIDYRFPMVSFEVRCGKGTYIRSLARDIGVELTGNPACLTELRRTYSAPYHVDQATPLDALKAAMTRDDLLPPPPAAQ